MVLSDLLDSGYAAATQYDAVNVSDDWLEGFAHGWAWARLGSAEPLGARAVARLLDAAGETRIFVRDGDGDWFEPGSPVNWTWREIRNLIPDCDTQEIEVLHPGELPS